MWRLHSHTATPCHLSSFKVYQPKQIGKPCQGSLRDKERNLHHADELAPISARNFQIETSTGGQNLASDDLQTYGDPRYHGVELHVPDRRLRRRTIATAHIPPLRGLSGYSQIEAADALHKITTNSIHRTSRSQQTWGLGRSLLDFEQAYARVIPDARGALRNEHLACENKAPKQGLIPAKRQRRPLEEMNPDRGGLDAAN